MIIKLIQNNHSIEAELILSNPLIIKIDENEIKADISQISENLFSIIINNESWFVSFNERDDQIYLSDSKKDSIIKIQNELEMLLLDFGYRTSKDEKSGKIYASIPGLITKLFVKVGENIKFGNRVCILEAMKMENEITSQINGNVKAIHVEEGSSVEKGKLLMEIEQNVLE